MTLPRAVLLAAIGLAMVMVGVTLLVGVAWGLIGSGVSVVVGAVLLYDAPEARK